MNFKHLCDPKLCWLHNRDTLFNNSMIRDFPQWHYISFDGAVDQLILDTCMVTSKQKLRRLREQDAVKFDGRQLTIGQRHLIIEGV